jgi:hypothetical protein
MPEGKRGARCRLDAGGTFGCAARPRPGRVILYMAQLERVAYAAVGEVARSWQIIVAHGAGKFLPSARCRRPAPTTRLQREMEWHFRVAPVDEHHTHQLLYGTEARLGGEGGCRDAMPSLRGAVRPPSIGMITRAPWSFVGAYSVAPNARCTCGVGSRGWRAAGAGGAGGRMG